MARVRYEGPCQNCGTSLATHTRREMRYCQEAFFHWLSDMLVIGEIVFTLGKIFANPKKFEQDMRELSDNYTSGIRAIMNTESKE